METAIEHAVGDDAPDLLVERARRRDTRAFESLYREHRGRVYALALRLTRDAQAAEDLTQDAFVRAWKGLPGFRGDSRFTTWLHTITVRAHLKNQRTRQRRAAREVTDGEIETYAFTARRALEGTDIDLERAIASLPDGAREVLVLYDIHGYRHREIGSMLGIAEGTAKAQLHRARKLVRRYLDG
ncbi:MAG: RNA polymerase sigma factor [Gemmatimonadota bacterium]|nr:RNA polymerase sigma factor [Gemmatimonadota bacterium]